MKHEFNFKKWKAKKIASNEWWDNNTLRPHNLVVKNTCDDTKREIIFDTETTGLSKKDRIVELSMLEIIDGIKTGRKLHFFFNPETKISERAVEIHRITNEDVKDAPLFKYKAREILIFVGHSNIIAHNANFDRRMLNQELKRCGWEMYPKNRFIDTLKIARYLYPQQPCNQDALCLRFYIENTNRVTTGIHSAYEDTIQLYFIYKKLCNKLEEKEKSIKDFFL
jgi:DNA polymerase-3 subunit epsilon